MKMFIWKDAYNVSYGSAVAVAIAETVEEAERLVENAEVSPYGMDPIMVNGERHRRPGANVKGIEPTRVYDLPCAEIFEWSE